VAPEDVVPAAERLARRIAARPPAAVRAAMQCLNGGLEPASAIAQLLERRCFEGLIESAEVRRALAALPAGSGERREGCPT
jgi:enoyl-CoA hydratase/carnithine racemase